MVPISKAGIERDADIKNECVGTGQKGGGWNELED